MNEFGLIRQYFTFSTPDGAYPAREGSEDGAVALGVGDDCALIEVPPGHQLAVTTDTLVSGVHFPHNADPSLLARRALRVNLSDLAAMGAQPLGFQLALTLPEIDSGWLQQFSAGLAEDATQFSCPLVGGDTTRGPLAITITTLGTVPAHCALKRTGARPGDVIGVSGCLGDAAMALNYLEKCEGEDYLLQRYWLPEPRLELGGILASAASAGLDVSDGLLQDVGHIARASGLTARIEFDAVPVSPQLISSCGSESDARWTALSGGDDYELCFTASDEGFEQLAKLAAEAGCPITRIGRMLPCEPGDEAVICIDSRGDRLPLGKTGYDHFNR